MNTFHHLPCHPDDTSDFAIVVSAPAQRSPRSSCCITHVTVLARAALPAAAPVAESWQRLRPKRALGAELGDDGDD